ncbi:MAG: vitamin K epoxide reductase family protein [Patescibacteria group bacterium]
MYMIVTFVACLCGIILSSYIYIKKRRNQRLACPREHPCDTVLHSHFSKTFGVPTEILGVGYFISVLVLIFLPLMGFSPAWDLYLLFFLLVIGGLFSLYLIGLQVLVIRSWCAWCLGVAFTNLVLIVSLSHIPTELFAPLLKVQKVWWLVLHNLGFILGVGAATITDILFFRFLKDGKISLEEKGTMDTLTNTIWLALGILVVSGLALFIPEQTRLAVSSKFLLKLVVIGAIILNGFILNMFVAPYMRRLSFEGTAPARHFRRLAFALGGISFTSWYIAFFLGSFRKIPISFSVGLVGYAVILILVIIFSQFVERHVAKKHGTQESL